MRKKFFLYSQIYRDQKIGGKKREIIFPETQQIVRAKNVRKKIVGKRCEKTFFIITRISCPKMGWKNRAKQFFQKQTNRASKKCSEKIVAKKCEKTFFYSQEYRVQKMGGEKRAK